MQGLRSGPVLSGVLETEYRKVKRCQVMLSPRRRGRVTVQRKPGREKDTIFKVERTVGKIEPSELCKGSQRRRVQDPFQPNTDVPSSSLWTSHLHTLSIMCVTKRSEIPGQDSSARLKAFSSSSIAPTPPPLARRFSFSCLETFKFFKKRVFIVAAAHYYSQISQLSFSDPCDYICKKST